MGGRPEPARGGPPPKRESTAAPPTDPHHSIAGQHHSTAGAVDRSSPTGAARHDPLLPSDSQRFLDDLRALGLAGIRACTLTRNRSTLISFRGDHLRVHRAFATAPAPVLQAVVNFVNGRGIVRRRARQALAAFQIPPDPHAPARTRRREATHPDDALLIDRLSNAHRQLNQTRFDGSLGLIEIRISRRMKTRLGHFSPGGHGEPPHIAIARRHIRRDAWTAVLETLAHEMVHQWQDETGRLLAHDPDFRRKAREVGIHTGARRDAGRVS